MRLTLAALVSLATLVGSAGAQGLADFATIFGPQYVNYRIGSGEGERTVTQLSFPIAFILPITSRFALDVSTSYADSRVSSNGVESSKITGLTDTQVRANYTIGDNRAVFTIGVNAPTGMYKVPDAQQEAAGQIGSDFLLYPVSSMGSGLATTGGLALAWTLGGWNFGFGGSYRHSSPFDAFQVQTNVLRFEPGSESRVRLGIDRAIGEGRIAVAGTYSAFTDDKADSTTFSTGARSLAQASLYFPTSTGDISISGWNLYRAEGQQIGAVSPWENIASGNVAIGFNLGGLYVQPSVEGRAWMRGGYAAGALGTGGLRLRFSVGPLSVNPNVTYTIGNVYPIGSYESIDVKGLRGMLLVRIR